MKYYPSNKTNKTLRLAAVAAATLLALSACGKGGEPAGQAGGAAGQQAPAPVVGVVTVQPQSITVSTDLPGRLESRRSADILPQVGGIIKKHLFQEGSYVKAGQALYQLDDAAYLASLESARAELASAQATLAKADADLARYKPLVAADAISRQDYDAAVQAKRSGEAGVKAAQAAIKSARINVERSRISAPISGYIGQSYVSEGALVSAGGTAKLATIQQTNPMYVNLTQSATDAMKLRQDIAEGKMKAVNGAVAVDIKLENGQTYGHKGRLLFADPTVDETTGQVTLRAEVPNPDNILLPNLYVRVSLPQADMENVFVVPQQAVTRGNQDTVMIVNAQGGMEPRKVTVAQQYGNNWLVSDGLKAGDKVIVDGMSIAGMMQAKKVTPKEWTPPGGQAPQAASAAQNDSAVQTAYATESAASGEKKQ
ncbi:MULTISPECIES: efflux RND transporter periplasmic adaptor subunit [unclassified Neisseria]|uniref:efflux RND transporter periplasmic adaptor subunit n=1 Tax=unclassified Neisseria TaxID=2623750 RepID=UPI0010721755|nr:MULTISPECIES: efflux RND transporter periplasmic adaptor subunit [unclassified Neisseria]MBF0802816.1 efflux RND transporter periplasmic adaptor subunit [Neisseria sp. 19428wB4_WF04]TFU44656.1 efflux RND transporter periplasmic adaptor subunit [Neisseria sp. WF04]